MCGIVGVLDFQGAMTPELVLQNMCQAIAHRGPDGEGTWQEGGMALGHRRLAIIDLSTAGHQPMLTEDKRYVISYNGEVYNFRELRQELERNGYGFRSHTDTEIVLTAFACWGLDALQKFNGMFAFAIWDTQEKKLYLARDRYGIKPLYYTIQDNKLIFASEIKAILQHPSIQARKKLDLEALYEYFTFQNIFTDRTLIQNIKLLDHGSVLSCHLDAHTPDIKVYRYWDYQFEEPENQTITDAEYKEQLDYLFKQAINRQLVSDVGVSAYLSGGMDSGSITSLAAQQMPYIRTFTCGFDLSSASGMELNFDERQAAERMSYLFKTEHYEMVLKAGDMERVMPKLAYHIEEPRVGQSYPNYYISQLASKFDKVVLAGTGGDELFGGYPWRYYRALVNTDFEHYIDKYYQYWQRLLPNKQLQQLFSPVYDKVKHVWTRDIFKDTFNQHAEYLTRPEDYINHSLYFEAKTFLHSLLVVEDKLSMAHGLETRVPFLDNDLVDFAMRVPVRMKLGKMDEVLRLNENEPGEKTAQYFKKTRDGKLLLRDAMKKYIPDEITQREKQGFSAPDASWFQGESIDYVKNLLFNDKAKIYDFMDKKTTHDLLNEHFAGITNRRLLVWSLLSVENFCQAYSM